MASIRKGDLPARALLNRYRRPGGYTDCYTATVPGAVAIDQFVLAFYTTPLFKLERFVLKWLLARPSTDWEATQFARGQADRFAAWNVEQRDDNQLLVSDYRSSTRSWFMTEPQAHGDRPRTRLYFGSAVISGKGSGESILVRLLLPFHRIYSRALLRSAMVRLN